CEREVSPLHSSTAEQPKPGGATWRVRGVGVSCHAPETTPDPRCSFRAADSHRAPVSIGRGFRSPVRTDATEAGLKTGACASKKPKFRAFLGTWQRYDERS